MHYEPIRQRLAPEVKLLFVVVGTTGLFHLVPTYRMAILHLYFLPVVLAGFFLGRFRAAFVALLSVTPVATTVLGTSGGAHIPALAVFVWAATLFLTALVVGTVNDVRLRKIDELNESHKTDTMSDPLTEVANRRAFQYELTRRMAEWNRRQTPLALILMDIDHFKKFNDTYGHQVGDVVLRNVARVVQATVREVDLVARYGGEEFAIVLPNTSLADTKEAAERVRRVIESTRFDLDGVRLRLTISVGVAHVRPSENADSLVQRADRALYTSKQAGRNCAHFHNGTGCEHFGASLPSPPASRKTDALENWAGADAYTDSPTGLPSRKVFNEELRRRVSEAHRYDTHLTLALVQLDNYQRIEAQAAQAGDAVVATVSELVRAVLRDSDLVTRYTTSQLALLLPATPWQEARIPAERIRQRVDQCASVPCQGARLPFSVSIALAEWNGHEDPSQFLQRVQTGVHAAQSDGGNRVYWLSEGPCQPPRIPSASS